MSGRRIAPVNVMSALIGDARIGFDMPLVAQIRFAQQVLEHDALPCEARLTAKGPPTPAHVRPFAAATESSGSVTDLFRR